MPWRRQTSPSWVNTPVLMEALQRYERGELPHSLQLWLEDLLELDAPPPRRPQR